MRKQKLPSGAINYSSCCSFVSFALDLAFRRREDRRGRERGRRRGLIAQFCQLRELCPRRRFTLVMAALLTKYRGLRGRPAGTAQSLALHHGQAVKLGGCHFMLSYIARQIASRPPQLQLDRIRK